MLRNSGWSNFFIGGPLVIRARCFFFEIPTKTTGSGRPVARRPCGALEHACFLSGVRSLISQEMRRISAIFLTRRPPVEPPPEPERKRPPIHPPERTPKPTPIQDPPVPPPPGKEPEDEPTPIGDPPGETDQPIRVKRGRPGSIVHGVNEKGNFRHSEMKVSCGRAETSSTGTREKM